LSGNFISGNGDEGILVIEGSDSNTIIGNTLFENDSDEIDIKNCSFHIIYGNIVTGGPGGGIETTNSNNNYIFLNTVKQAHIGIQIKGLGPNNMIFKNTLKQNTFGTHIDGSNENRIYENELSYNEYSGIDLDFCTNNHFYNNEIRNNPRGIDLNQAIENFVYNNNFVENINQAKYSTEINNWNLVDKGGNYWSNYEGVDEDTDGFGDTPHVLKTWIIGDKEFFDEDNLDQLPLINPKIINTGKEPSEITCNVPVGFVTEGGTIHITGELKREYNYPVPNEDTEIILTVEKPSGSQENIPIQIIDGSYEHPYQTETYGEYKFIASWEGNMLYEGDTSDLQIFTVEQAELPPPKNTLLTISLDSPFEPGSTVRVDGRLETDEGIGIPNERLDLVLPPVPPMLGEQIVDVYTNGDGYYEYESEVFEEEGGAYQYKIRYGGSSSYKATKWVDSPEFFIGFPEEPTTESEPIPGFPFVSILLGFAFILLIFIRKPKLKLSTY
jgi:parallel beta-helix repeat protein